MFDKKSQALIKKVCGIAYKRGFIDGMNFERVCEGNGEEITAKTFEEFGIAEIIDAVIENLSSKGRKTTKKLK